MLGVVLLNEVLHDRSRFEEPDTFSIGESVCESGNSTIGVDIKEPLLFLSVFGNVHFVCLVGKPVFAC